MSDIYLNGNIAEQYMLCYYWMVATLTTNGQVGDMTPKSMLEVSRGATTCFCLSMQFIVTFCVKLIQYGIASAHYCLCEC